MSSTVLIDVAGAGGDPVRTLPHRWVVAAAGEYAHLPRSAARYDDGTRLCVTALCGVSMQRPVLTDLPAGPWCGTCVGRELGLTSPGGAWRPRTARTLPKRWCRADGFRPVTDRVGVCLNCGSLQPIRARYGWNTSGAVLQRHEHYGAGRCCLTHGQQWLTTGGGRLVCRPPFGPCDERPRPFWTFPAHPGGSIR